MLGKIFNLATFLIKATRYLTIIRIGNKVPCAALFLEAKNNMLGNRTL